MSAREWTSESIGRFGGANIWYMVESPVQHRDLGNSTDNQAHRLHEEQVTRGNLLFLSAALIKNRTRYSDTCIAVNPELKILRKGKTFGGGYGPKGKKPDVSKDFPFPNISSNQAAEELNANFCICGCEYPSNLIFFSSALGPRNAFQCNQITHRDEKNAGYYKS